MADALLAEFQELNKQLCALWAKKDFKGIAETFYDKDCRLMPAGHDTIIGREAIAGHFEKGYSIYSLDFSALEVVPGGENTATERGCYTMKNKEGEVTETGKYVVLRKKENGKWLAYFDINSPNKV